MQLAWLSVWSEVQIVCVMVQLMPLPSHHLLPFWCRLTRLSFKKLFNRCSVVESDSHHLSDSNNWRGLNHSAVRTRQSLLHCDLESPEIRS